MPPLAHCRARWCLGRSAPLPVQSWAIPPVPRSRIPGVFEIRIPRRAERGLQGSQRRQPRLTHTRATPARKRDRQPKPALRYPRRKRRPHPGPPPRPHLQCRHSNSTLRFSRDARRSDDASAVPCLTPFRSRRTNRNRENQREAIPNNSFARIIAQITRSERHAPYASAPGIAIHFRSTSDSSSFRKNESESCKSAPRDS
jgi:hypothetical protein